MFEITDDKEYDFFGKMVSQETVDIFIAYLKTTPSFKMHMLMQEQLREVCLEHALKPETIERFKRIISAPVGQSRSE